MAPEMFKDNEETSAEAEYIPYHDEKVDIWAFGMTLMELVLREQPLETFANSWDKVATYLKQFKAGRTDDENYAGSALGKILLNTFESNPSLMPRWARARKQNEEFMMFVSSCLITDPENRPSAAELCEHPFLQGYIDDVIFVENNRNQPFPKRLLPLRTLVLEYEELAKER